MNVQSSNLSFGFSVSFLAYRVATLTLAVERHIPIKPFTASKFESRSQNISEISDKKLGARQKDFSHHLPEAAALVTCASDPSNRI